MRTDVSILIRFLEALRSPVQALGGNASLGGIAEALHPFAAMPIEDFTSFLKAADEYRRSGAVKALPPVLHKLEESLRSGQEGHGFQPMADDLVALGASCGLKVTAKVDAKLQKQLETERRFADTQRALGQLAARVTAPEDYAKPEVQEAFAAARSMLPAAEWKTLAKKMDVPLGKGADPATAIVSKLAGIAPPPPEKAAKGKAKKEVDPEVVRLAAQKLRELSERSKDPDQLSLAQIEAALADFAKLDEPTLKAAVQASKLDIAGRTKKDLLADLRRHLDAAHRARAEVAV